MKALMKHIESYVRKQAADAINTTHNILHTRIDQFGKKNQPFVLDANRGRIIAEIAGVDNPARVRRLLGKATANLNFKNVQSYRNCKIIKRCKYCSEKIM